MCPLNSYSSNPRALWASCYPVEACRTEILLMVDCAGRQTVGLVVSTGLNRHSPDSSGCASRIAPLIASSNGNFHSSRAKRARSCRSGARTRGIGDLGGLSQIFPDQCASRVRVRDDITCGCGGGFRAAVFLSLIASMRVQQSATPLQIVPGKTLRQAPQGERLTS